MVSMSLWDEMMLAQKSINQIHDTYQVEARHRLILGLSSEVIRLLQMKA
jgi:hypothetical protein